MIEITTYNPSIPVIVIQIGKPFPDLKGWSANVVAIKGLTEITMKEIKIDFDKIKKRET